MIFATRAHQGLDNLKIRETGTEALHIMRKTLQHYLNPLHIYCRLLNLGFPRRLAVFISRFYERDIFTLFSGKLYRY